MAWIKTQMMEKLKMGLGSFAASLKEKGYDGAFLTDGACPDDLTASVSGFLEENLPEGHNSLDKSFLLETYLQWDGEERERILAILHVKLTEGKFELHRLDVELRDRHHQLTRSRSLEGITTATIPGKRASLAMVKASLEQAKRAGPKNRFRPGLLLWLLLIVPFGPANAQSTWFKEWFRQKKTQKEYLMAQIAGLQAYIQVARKGYGIARKGLTAIGHIKDGDFNLHRDFFASLKNVNPALKDNAKLAGIIAMQAEIIKTYKQDTRRLRQVGLLNAGELAYIGEVYGRLLDGCAHVLDELILLATDAELEMKDDERIGRIETLYEEMRQNRAFCRGFGSRAKLLAAQRRQELEETKNARLWNGLD